ncbi:phosphatidylinositol 3-kinase [Striga asiatica]|uniref:phosphatidylinositol 3-kinase n=1 Tax=Striga asiatica TaxID=4170 RepID=A0A5A7PLR1_STRAF|nr:phosphatidylinositol 3-kinase [Striga asiatica]
MSGNEFRFFLSCDINLPLTFKIERLEGKLSPLKPPDSDDSDCIEERKPELYVECLLYVDGAPFGLPMRTRLESVGPSYCWNELVTLSTKYRDLTANSQLALTVYDVSCGKNEEVVGGATIHLFNMKKQLKTGKHKLRLWAGKEADGSINTTTPGKYERGQIQRVDWLDRLAFKAMEKIKERESIKKGGSHLYVVVDFCSFEHRVVFQEAKQALELMGKWETIDVCDALELLSPVFESEEFFEQLWIIHIVSGSSKCYQPGQVRAYAVSVLERADDEELQCYLLQLVQALRFERSDKSRLSQFLVQRSLCNIDLASFLRWYVAVELHDPVYARRFYSTYECLEESMLKLGSSANGDEDGFKLWQSLVRQTELTAQLCSIMREVRNVRGGTQKKIEKLRQLLSGLHSELTYFDEPTRSPLAPRVLITGIIPSESSIFKSALNPLRLALRTASGGSCKIIFKKGDDLRQDQLVIQMVSLMDRLLKLENLDLHLTPYRVLATGHDEGMMEFIPSKSLAQILSEHRSITSYLQKFHPDEDGHFGITATCLETFIKSCAGYSVITYILGIGDRHLDNLLLQDDGRLFHVDFGFILGRDPKPFPPPMKLCKEMVEAMGGAESQYYTRFKSYCCEAYNILRKSSNLILNLFHLMAGSNIPDIASDPEKGILKVKISINSVLLLGFVLPYKKSFGWTWTMRSQYIFSRILSTKVLVHYSHKWWKLSTVGLNIGADLTPNCTSWRHLR